MAIHSHKKSFLFLITPFICTLMSMTLKSANQISIYDEDFIPDQCIYTGKTEDEEAIVIEKILEKNCKCVYDKLLETDVPEETIITLINSNDFTQEVKNGAYIDERDHTNCLHDRMYLLSEFWKKKYGED